MSFLDVFKKKKKVPLKELELPPPANEALATGYNELEDMPPYREIETPASSQLQQFPIPFESFMQKEQPVFHQEDFSAPLSFDKPREPTPVPSGLSDLPVDMPPMPLPFEREMKMKEEQQKVQQHGEKHQEQLSLFSDISKAQTPQFRFYESAEDEMHEQHEEEHAMENIPSEIDIAKELLAVPKEQKPIVKQQKKEINVMNKKQFILMTTLEELGEQLFHLQDDLTLAKDTAFRVADLNEQEIEQLAKWQTFCNSMELKIAEMDKTLFKV